jgi:hypothetical protein
MLNLFLSIPHIHSRRSKSSSKHESSPHQQVLIMLHRTTQSPCLPVPVSLCPKLTPPPAPTEKHLLKEIARRQGIVQFV